MARSQSTDIAADFEWHARIPDFRTAVVQLACAA
jgi:hypothetical protein